MKSQRYRARVVVIFTALLVCLTAGAEAQPRKSYPPRNDNNPLHELISGYHFNDLALRSLQDDDFDNPAFAWVTQGEKLWTQIEGTQRKSCASCHPGGSEAMRGKAATYPKFYSDVKRVISLEQRINLCRENKMGAVPWPYTSDALQAMTAYLRLQSRNMPIGVEIDGAAAQTFTRGKSLYFARMGRYGMSCAQCHNERYGSTINGKIINQGHPNGTPAYSVSAQKIVSLHERFQKCHQLMRAEPYELGSPEYIALELYLNWRADGLPLEAPAVRR